MSFSRINLYIDLNTIVNNYISICNKVKPAVVLSVLKSNSYGLGMPQIATELIKVGCSRFGVSNIEEAIVLRELTNKPIHILGELHKQEVQDAVRFNIICPGASADIIKEISQESVKQNKTTLVHYLIDTGMGRLGLKPDSCFDTINKTMYLPGINIEGIYSHFPIAYDRTKPMTLHQIKLFSTISNQYLFHYKHIANSDGVNGFSNSYFNMVRVGLSLYGMADMNSLIDKDYISSPITMHTDIIAIRRLKKGSTIGYGCYRLKEDKVIGTIPIGYADGFPLGAQKGGYVIVNEKKSFVIGRISMDYTTIDLTNIKCSLGDKVILIGEMKNKDLDIDRVTIEDWANWKSTHNYEVICSLGTRIKRHYLNVS